MGAYMSHSMSQGRSAGIVGGGIGGLASAIALRKAGWQVTVYERAPEFTEVGAGISLFPNAITALDALGVGTAVQAAGVGEAPGEVRNAAGRVLFTRWAKPLAGGFTVLHRADLISLLAQALPSDCLRPGSSVDEVTLDGTLRVGGESVRHDLIVGADGVHSAIRQRLWPGDTAVRRTGITAWRGVLDTPVPKFAGGVVGVHAEFGVLPMQGGRTYFFAAAHPGFDSLDHFTEWASPVPEVLAAADPARILRDEFLEVPVPRMLALGKVALVGDSAHAMRPELGQGAAMAIEDAVTLAAYAPDLRAYSKARRRRVRAVSWISRQMTHNNMPNSRWRATVRDVGTRAVPEGVALAPMSWLFRWHAPAPVSADAPL
ncbi:2-polyprenyl-6-methoxyphenol hydroxylase-like FAD-dependent oxidoreductase [Kitasatospora sp. MAA4]|nr:2-polyprenyl-6-methoxyphenol hydroxylase-like FAD-dependent oxidoreductase [Kitasatospora sp. MAA4]